MLRGSEDFGELLRRKSCSRVHRTIVLRTACFFMTMTASLALTPRDAKERADAWLRPYVEAGDFSGVLLIAQGDRVLVEQAYGSGNPADSVSGCFAE